MEEDEEGEESPRPRVKKEKKVMAEEVEGGDEDGDESGERYDESSMGI